MAGQSPHLHADRGVAADWPPGSPGDLVGSGWRLWELDLCWASSSSFLSQTEQPCFSSLDTVIVWHGVLGVRGVPGLGCPAKAQSGMTPKLIMYLAVGRDPRLPRARRRRPSERIAAQPGAEGVTGSRSHLAAEDALFPAEKLNKFSLGLVEFLSKSLICHFWGPSLHPSPQLLQRTLLALGCQLRSPELEGKRQRLFL